MSEGESGGDRAYRLALREAAEPRRVDVGLVNKDVILSIVQRNEAIALLDVEPAEGRGGACDGVASDSDGGLQPNIRREPNKPPLIF